ncbi:MAG: hypothetical protein RMY34_22130 [Aulosira sp. DedQUE10]|nr:hypothetical protein [Aulosira sp. DedQUE10]
MRKKIFLLSSLFSLIYLPIIASPVNAETICKITDPTGTPLNVRDTPNGKVINQLKNGRAVYIDEIAYDLQGKPWSKISGHYNGQYKEWGWVIREFISCYDSSLENQNSKAICEVTDPTGTPLNVRDKPNGKVINQLRNGRAVYIDQITYDGQGRPWSKISGYYKGQYKQWGWVIREFVSCYKNPI